MTEVSAFFDQLPREVRRQPSDVALAYAKAFSGEAAVGLLPGERSVGVHNVAVVSRSAELTAMTKRISLISDTLITSHEIPESSADLHFVDGSAERVDYGEMSEIVSFACPHLGALGSWLLACEPLLRTGSVRYFPATVRRKQYMVDSQADPYAIFAEPVSEKSRLLPDFVIDNRKIVENSTDQLLTSQLVTPILEVELPFLEGTSMADFASISVEETRALEAFRDLLRHKFLELDDAAGSLSFRRSLELIGIELRDGVRMVDADMHRVQRRRAVQAAGGVLATVTATLAMIEAPAMAAVAAVAGASGGAWSLVSAMDDHLARKSTATDRPYYFLWLLGRATQ